MDARKALPHVGHDIEVATYGPHPDDIWNVAIECKDCGEVIVDVDMAAADEPAFEDLSDDDKRFAADGWLERAQG